MNTTKKQQPLALLEHRPQVSSVQFSPEPFICAWGGIEKYTEQGGEGGAWGVRDAEVAIKSSLEDSCSDYTLGNDDAIFR